MGAGSHRQSPENVMVLINRLAAEVADDEAELRHRILGLIDGGSTDDAKALLQAWDVMAAGSRTNPILPTASSRIVRSPRRPAVRSAPRSSTHA